MKWYCHPSNQCLHKRSIPPFEEQSSHNKRVYWSRCLRHCFLCLKRVVKREPPLGTTRVCAHCSQRTVLESIEESELVESSGDWPVVVRGSAWLAALTSWAAMRSARLRLSTASSSWLLTWVVSGCNLSRGCGWDGEVSNGEKNWPMRITGLLTTMWWNRL